LKTLKHLFDRNRAWAADIERDNPGFFSRLAQQQAPEYLWIGCSDSRVSANQIVDLLPGEVFVHRNIANIVAHADVNCLSVIHFAVEVLRVKHIIVCGHYGCGGVQAAMQTQDHGFIENWLCHVKDVKRMHAERLQQLDEKARFDLLCELNVKAQVMNVSTAPVVQEAWKRGQELYVHGWIYDIANGLLKDLEVSS
jgi:carbonic anhydrase